MKVAVTGAHGMLGSDVVKVLQEQKFEVLPFPTHAELDLADFGKVRDFVVKNKPEVVVHLAASRNPDVVEKDPAEGWRSNFNSTYNLVRALLETGGVMCYGSTDSVFSGHDDEGPYHEFSMKHPLNIYGQTKYASEQIIKQKMQKYFILRLPWLFGLGGRPEINPLLNLFKKTKAGEKTVVGSDMWSSACATLDVGWAIGKIIATQESLPQHFVQGGQDASRYGTYHVASEPAVSRTGMMRYILQQAGMDANLVEETNYVDARKPAKRAHYSVMTSVLLEPTFGFKMPSWQIGMQKCIAELKIQGVI
jgi:dTDP-4-dehydrorhamnose reductase